jgi:hypothetical protein
MNSVVLTSTPLSWLYIDVPLRHFVLKFAELMLAYGENTSTKESLVATGKEVGRPLRYFECGGEEKNCHCSCWECADFGKFYEKLPSHLNFL